MLLTVRKVQNEAILAPILAEHPRCFDTGTTLKAEHLTLVLKLFYEIGLGHKSYWYPWLRQMLGADVPGFWTEEELAMLQDHHCVGYLEAIKLEKQRVWPHFKEVLTSNKALFGGTPRLISEPLFHLIYHQVLTRCVDAGLNSITMIPMFDNLNHSNMSITNEMINLSMHCCQSKLEQWDTTKTSAKYFKIQRYLADYRSVFEARGWPKGRISKNI